MERWALCVVWYEKKTLQHWGSVIWVVYIFLRNTYAKSKEIRLLSSLKRPSYLVKRLPLADDWQFQELALLKATLFLAQVYFETNIQYINKIFKEFWMAIITAPSCMYQGLILIRHKTLCINDSLQVLNWIFSSGKLLRICHLLYLSVVVFHFEQQRTKRRQPLPLPTPRQAPSCWRPD